jgi:glucose/arabinose dehydrogenase
MRARTALLLGGLLAALGASPPLPALAAETYAPATGLRLERVADGLESPVHLTSPPGDPRLFVVEQRGRIRIIARGRLLPRPFLDLTDRVGYGGERGLLSVAFHRDYATNGLLFVNYTDRAGDTRVERYRVTANPDRADSTSGVLLLRVVQPFANHNGGHILFGPDRMLWIGMGDGGSAGDPMGHGQNPQTLLGAILRIDVDHGTPYAIPRDNPFADGRRGRPEIWAIGVRNPGRMWIDDSTRALYVADVGQNQWEELDVVPLARGGLNFGWNLMEGNHRYRGFDRPDGLVAPLLEYSHRDGCSVTGGLVYRGRRVPALRGAYLFSDYCRGWLRSFRVENGRAVDLREWKVPSLAGATSFGRDADGEAYVLVQSGVVWRIAAE